jgi:hypothetical protein
MLDSIRSRVGLAILMVIIAAILVTIVLSYPGGSGKINSTSNEDHRRIITYTPIFDHGNITYTLNYAKMQDIQVNSAVRFLNPFGKSMSGLSLDANTSLDSSMTENQKIALVHDADVFEQYILIRLPSKLGGDLQNVSAFRAYSSLDPESKCLLGYRHYSETVTVLEDPCHSDIFRVSDGYSCFGRIIGSNPVLSGYNAIPRLKLELDAQGYFLATRPDGAPSGDGTVGDGRIIPIEEIKAHDSDPTCEIIQSQ